jgi:hypothetical protein
MLKIWLPFNENLKNNGLDSNTIAINGSVSYADAIFGKGLSCNGSSYLTVSPFTLGTKATFAWWAKTNDNSAMFWVVNAKVYAHLNFWLHSKKYYLNVGDSLNNPFQNNGTDVVGYDDNVWHHLAVVFDGSVCSLYVDGAYYGKAKTYKSPETNGATNIRIAGGFANAHDYDTLGTMCDFRVYDHVLEPWEIKDLSNQKVFEMFGGLHVEGATNISNQGNCGGWNNSGTASRENNVTSIPNTPCKAANTVRITETTDGQCAITFGTSTQHVPSKTITASVYLYITGNITSVIQPYIRSSAKDNSLGNLEYEGNATFSTWPKDKWIRVTKTITTSSAETTVYFCAYTAKSGCSLAFNGWQIEERDHASPYALGNRDAWSTDMSCYKMASEPYNIIKSGTSAYFNGTDSAIKIPIAETITGGTWTINLWFYRPNGEWGTKAWETLIGGPSGFELSSKNGGTNTPQVRTYSWTNSGYTYEYDKWNMVTLTRTSSGAKCYLNGELKHNGTAGAVPNNNYFIGAWNTATQQNFKGYIKSLSVYKKALTQEDITNLYIHGQ